jgi:hypothetical protein
MGNRDYSATAHDAATLTHMDSKQRALAAEVRAEMGKQQVKASALQKALGISSTAWGTYFVQCTRDVPVSVIFGVAEHLGMTGSELLRRAEVASADAPTTTMAQLEAMLSPAARQVVEEERARLRAERNRGGGVPEDPPGAATGGRRSA